MFSSVIDVRTALTPGAVSGDNSTASKLEDEQIADAIAEADSRIVSYLPDGYTIPTQQVQQGEGDDPPPPTTLAHNLIRFWSRDIAAYLATLTFKRNKDVSENDPVRLRYNAAMADLVRVTKGELTLPEDEDPSDDGLGDVVVYNQYEGRMFGLEDFDLVSGYGHREYYRRSHGMM